MIGFINSWAQGIILAVIIATIIEIILPEGKNKKYVKTIIGIYIIFVMVYPLVSKITSKNINIEELLNSTISKTSKYETDNELAINTNTYIEETYKQKLEDDIKRRAVEKNYEINFLDLNIETDNENYGQINSINMKISKKEDNKKIQDNTNNTNNNINQIEKVEIKVSNNNNKREENEKNEIRIPEDEINEFKEYLANSYGIEKENIHVNE